MVVEAQLSRDQLVQLTLLRHIQRPTFYFNALTSSIFIAYGILADVYLILFVAWIPFVLYLALGAMKAHRVGSDKENPLLQPTTYEFSDKGIRISSAQAKSYLDWKYVTNMKLTLQCYVLMLTNGQMIAIPEEAIPPEQKTSFQTLVLGNIKQRLGQ